MPELNIEKLVYGGHGLAHWENKPVLVPFVAAGENVDVEIKHKKQGIYWSKLNQVLKSNPDDRVSPVCKYFTFCGGCSYQHLNYNAQISAKEGILKEIYSNNIPLSESIVSPLQLGYRNKCEFSFGEDENGELALGMHPPGKFFEVLQLDECHLLPKPMMNLLQEVLKFAKASKLGPFKDLKGTGFWSTATIRYSYSRDEMLLILKVGDQHHPILSELADSLQKKNPRVIGLLAKQAPRGEVYRIFGSDCLTHSFNGVELLHHAESFFQINSSIYPKLVERLVELIQDSPPDLIYDLFAGVGSLGICVAKLVPSVKRVVCAESDKEACKLGELNAELNELENCKINHFDLFKGGWAKLLKEQAQNPLAIVDPPRAGLTKKTITELLSLETKRIIYVSCNPTTQRRDIDLLVQEGFKIKMLQLIDMFPQTMHLESIALLVKD
jgi:23S rRNA (uracil1939-C5)-methyltransferase